MTTRFPLVKLRPKEGRRVRAGAPWVFSNEIEMDGPTKALAPGTLVSLADAGGIVLGTGYFNPKSLIAVRLLAGPNAALDQAFFVGKIRRALNLREQLFTSPFYRLVHAEGDGLPGLVADRFGDTLVVQITTAGIETLMETILAAFDEVIAPRTIVLRNDAASRALEGLGLDTRIAKGEAGRVTVEENGIRYFADAAGGQKSGWYYDQRENRAFMARLANGKTVLDAYSYTGGFGILAVAQGARDVVAIDSSEPALDVARAAADENNVGASCHFVKGEVFAELERRAAANERFDVVICDPPPFVRARKDLEPGAKAYRKLARLAAQLVSPGGFLFLASCSHNMPRDRFGIENAAGIARAWRFASEIRDAGAGPDHPVHPNLPETAYLKAMVYALD